MTATPWVWAMNPSVANTPARQQLERAVRERGDEPGGDEVRARLQVARVGEHDAERDGEEKKICV